MKVRGYTITGPGQQSSYGDITSDSTGSTWSWTPFLLGLLVAGWAKPVMVGVVDVFERVMNIKRGKQG